MQCNGEKLFVCIVSLSVIVVVSWGGRKTRDLPIRSQSKDTTEYYNSKKYGLILISGFLEICC